MTGCSRTFGYERLALLLFRRTPLISSGIVGLQILSEDYFRACFSLAIVRTGAAQLGATLSAAVHPPLPETYSTAGTRSPGIAPPYPLFVSLPEIVDFHILSEDYSKCVFLCADRTVNFHAKFGAYYK